MALSGLVANLTASGLGSLAASMKRNKLEKKINSGIVEMEDLLWLGGFYLSKKDYFKAESFAKKASELDPNNYGVKNTLFNIYYSKADYSQAIKIVESLINEGKELSIHYFNLGYCYFKMGNLEKAEECKRKASEFDSKMRNEKYK